jgi:hypothetical protein
MMYVVGVGDGAENIKHWFIIYDNMHYLRKTMIGFQRFDKSGISPMNIALRS